MLPLRWLPVVAAGLTCAAMGVAGLDLHSALAQGADPFGDIDLNALKKNGTIPQTAPSPVAPSADEAPPPHDAVPAVAGAAPSRVILDNGNIYLVNNRPTRPTEFAVAAPTRIVKIMTYHWNHGRGARAGTIGLRGSRGETYGPWQARGKPGQGGVPSAYWIVEPDATIPAGRYRVIDSNPATWAQNAGTGGAGIVSVEGYMKEALK
jgi:hypothetical protein